MGIDAELDPAGYIPRWIERRALDLFKDRVVLPGVAPEIRLDGDKLRAQQSFLCQDQGLHDARQPSVSISKRMDGDDVQVRYRQPARYDDMVRIRCWVRDLASRRVIFGYAIERAETNELLATGETSLIALNPQQTLSRIPEHVCELLEPTADPVRL